MGHSYKWQQKQSLDVKCPGSEPFHSKAPKDTEISALSSGFHHYNRRDGERPNSMLKRNTFWGRSEQLIYCHKQWSLSVTNAIRKIHKMASHYTPNHTISTPPPHLQIPENLGLAWPLQLPTQLIPRQTMQRHTHTLSENIHFEVDDMLWPQVFGRKQKLH